MKTPRFSLCAALLSLGFVAHAATIDYTTYVETERPSGVLLTLPGDPLARGFAWQTTNTVFASKVWILEGTHTASDAPLFLSQGTLTEGAVSSVAAPAANCHRVVVSNLVAGTTYSYRLGAGDANDAYGTFEVKAEDGELTALFLSDVQTKDYAKLGIFVNTATRAVATAGGVSALDCVLFGGDLYDENAPYFGGTSVARYKWKYRMWGIGADTASSVLPGVPWVMASGNHDYTVYADTTAVDWQSSVSGCRSYDIGAAHVAVVPYLGGWNDTKYGASLDWLDADLAASSARWKIVILHWGPYVTGDHYLDKGKDETGDTSKLIKKMAPICSARHVDLVLQGHDHVFTKTLPYRWDAAGYTTALPNDAVVNHNPATVTIGGAAYDDNPKGTYYVSTGCAGHRVGENPAYAELNPSATCYTNGYYKIATDTIDVDSAWGQKGDNASHDLFAAMFGLLRVNGDRLDYDFYVVSTNGTEAPVLYDTLRVYKGPTFRVTPYVQHPATNAMSVLWFADKPGDARIAWWKEGADPATAETRGTTGVWAQALTNNLSDASKEDKGTGDKYKHAVRLTGLETGTRYTYAVELGSGVAYTNTFKTTPGPDSSVRFIYYNDPETLPAYRDKKTSDWIDPSTGKSRTYYASKNQGYASNIVEMVKREPDLYVIAGDLANQGGRQENWDSFWQHNAGGLGIGWNDPAGSTPILAAIGNHDLQDAVPKPKGMSVNCENVLAGETALDRYLTYFEVEPNGVDFSAVDDRDRSQMFHRVDYGPVTLIFLDTNNGDDDDPQKDTNIYLYRDATKTFPSKWGLGSARSPDFNPGSEQYNWLTNNLADARRKSKFTFVVCHHCPYSVGYHCRTNVTESGEWLSSRAVRVLDEAMVKYGVAGMLAGHDEMVEHSRISGMEVLDDGTTREHTVEIYDMGTAGDGLRGGQITKEANPKEVWRAHEDCPEVWEGGKLVAGGKHYGHMEVNVAETEPGVWTAKLEPVYVFVNQDDQGNAATFERRVYDDVKVLTNDLRVTPSVPWEGAGTEAEPYLIADEAGLVALQEQLADYRTNCFRLTADIPLTKKWAGIGVADKNNTLGGFEGVFDGAGHTISDVVFSNESKNNYRGLFNKVYKGTVKNLTVTGTGFGTEDLPSGEYGGAMVCGLVMDSMVSNCVAQGMIASGTHNVAGVVVRLSGNSSVIDCTNNADITGGYTKVAGVVCFAEQITNAGGVGLIQGCVNNGDITANGSGTAGRDGVGGIIAYLGAKCAITIRDCANTGVIAKGATASANNYIGQIVGYQHQAAAAMDGVITGRDDILMVAGVTKAAARHFATVDGDTATLIADNALALNGSYKVMADGASPTFAFTAAGTLAFDEALVAVKSFAGITAADRILVTSNKVGTVTTFTAVPLYTMTVAEPGGGATVLSVKIGGAPVDDPQAGAYDVPAGQNLVVVYAPLAGYEFAYDVYEITNQTLSADGAVSKSLAAREINTEFTINATATAAQKAAALASIATKVSAFADPQVAQHVKTQEEYLKFKSWAAGVGGLAAAGLAPNAYASYELRDVVTTPRLFVRAPAFEIVEATKAGVSGLVFGIRLMDGADEVAVAETCAHAIEVGDDLSEWEKIAPENVSVEDGVALVVMDQTEEKGFMRVKLAESTFYPISVDKTWCSVGTSVTWYDGYTGWQHTNRFNDGFQTRVLRSICFSQHTNCGSSGGRVADSVSDSKIVAADVYTIEHGINDWGNGVKVGTIDDYKNNTKNGTFAASYRKLVDKLRALNANAKIVVCTPRRGFGFYQGASKGYYLPLSSDEKSLKGNKTYLVDYVNIVRAIGEYEGFPVADFYANCGTDEELPSLSIDTALHPNDAGHERLAQELIPALLKALK